MRKEKRLFKKAFAGLMAIALFTTGIYMPGIFTKQVKAAEDEIVLPITLRDFDADNLLFEWCLEKDSIRSWGGSEVPYLSFSDATFAGRIPGAVFNGATIEYNGENFDASYVEKLVQDDLVNGHPQYRQETIQAVAEVVKGALEVPVTYDMKNYYASDSAYTYQEKLYRKVRAKLGTPVGAGTERITNPYVPEQNVYTSDDPDAPTLYAVTVELGSYVATKAKADAGQLNFDSMTTAMDYAYYMLNNFFVSKNDINTTYNNFQNITLKGDGQGNYTFDARKGETVGYHDDTKNISNDTAGATYTTNIGLFPLDKVATNEGIYLDSFSQASIDSAPADDPVKTKTPGQPHNFHYSLAGHSRFYYYDTSDLYFEFQGDDDVYLYINGKLALDIGGAHSLTHKTIYLNDLKDKLGLENGQVYDFDFFYMDRHTTNANLFIKTNIKLLDKGEATVKLSNTEGSLEDGDKVQEGTERIFPEYNFKANTGGVTDIKFTDDKIGITISKDGITTTSDDVKFVDPSNHEPSDKITVEITKNGVTEKKQYTSDEIKELFNNLTLNTNDTIKITGIETVAKDNDGDGQTHKTISDLKVDFTAPKYTGVGGHQETKEATAHQELGLLIGYTVRYVEKGTDTPVADSKAVKGIEYGQSVSESTDGVQINSGYKLNGNSTQNVTINENNQIITFEYIKLLNVNFISEDENKGTLEGTTEYKDDNGIPSGEKVPGVPTTVGKTGYTFTGWTIQGKGDNKVNPADETITEDTTFVAHFENAGYTYTVMYVDRQNQDKELAEADKDIAVQFNDVVTVTAKNVEGYTPEYGSKQFRIDEDKKIIKVLYDRNAYKVDFTTDGNGTLDGTTAYEDVLYQEKVPAKPDTVGNTGYDFVKWTMSTDGGNTEVDVEDPLEIEILSDTIFKAYFDKDAYPYIVKYVDKEGNELLPQKDGGKKTFGTQVTETAEKIEGYVVDENEKSLTIEAGNNEIVFVYEKADYTYSVKYVDEDGRELADPDKDLDAKFNEVVTATAKEVTGYTPIEASKQVTIDEDKKVIEIVYKKNSYSYVVKYVDEDGNDLLPQKEGGKKLFEESVTENAEDIKGYTPDKDSKSITITDGTNEIVFVYKKKQYNVTFDTDGNGTLDGTTAFKVNYEEKVEDVPKTNPNEDYEFVKWTMTVNDVTTDVVDPATIAITDDTLFTAHFTKLPTYEYTVKYVDKDGNELLPSETGKDIIDHVVTVNAKDIDGYKADKDKDSVKITEGKNEIVFVYTKQHNVKFETDGHGTLDGTTSYTVDDKEKVGEKPKTGANTGYEFEKWTMTVDGKTTDVEDPATVEITADTVFTAIFKEIPTTTEAPTTTAPTTAAPTTTPAPTTEKATTKKEKATKAEKTTKETTQQPATQSVVTVSAPKTGYNRNSLFMAVFIGFVAAMGGIVLLVADRRKRR